MADDQRIYSDEEFALILRKAVELPSRAEAPVTSSGMSKRSAKHSLKGRRRNAPRGVPV